MKIAHLTVERLRDACLALAYMACAPTFVVGQDASSAHAKLLVVLAGDSTVTDDSGWGAGFKKCLQGDIECTNLAKNGRSSKSYVDEGLWKKCLELKPDYILIQFGHNDQPGHPGRETDLPTYANFMNAYVDEARAAGVKPVLVTSLSRRQWGEDGKIHSTLTPQVEVVKQIAAEKQVPLVDLHAWSIALYEALGKEGCVELSPMKGDAVDNTHLNAKGGATVGPLVADELKRAVPELAAYIVVADAGPATASGQSASGPFQPTWESLSANYKCPDWFRDAKFGIWAHWTAQCVPEQGDWYARRMYLQGDGGYKYHLEHYGHPSEFGFKDIDNEWHAEHWEPEKLMRLYKSAGAKFFVALANHHDNYDCYDSTYHEWNSVRVGPHKDIVGTWAKAARDAGLQFGVSNHSAHAWHWFQVAYGYDPEGPEAGVRYDGRLTKADGKGKWWDGLDPQELYTGPNMVMPDGITSIKEANEWHKKHDAEWLETPPPENPHFAEKWLLRCNDLVDKYHPDLLYFDDTELPLGQAGLDAAAHFYNSNLAYNGSLQAVLTAKNIKPEHLAALVEDFERGSAAEIQPLPWQTCSCIGQWHYQRNCKYKTVAQVTRMLVNIVSKNGCLLLSIPLRGDGTIDDNEEAFLDGMGKWMAANGEGIYGTRPWHTFGEGPTKSAGGMFSEGKTIEYTAADMRFTTKDGALYVFVLAPPTEGVTVTSLAEGNEDGKRVAAVQLLGSDETLKWSQDKSGLVISKPEKLPAEDVVTFKVTFN